LPSPRYASARALFASPVCSPITSVEHHSRRLASALLATLTVGAIDDFSGLGDQLGR
jgi:hypothetical protein